VPEPEIEERISRLESAVSNIEKRNQRVDADKAWEVSRTRLFALLVLTYFITAIVFYIIEVDHFLANALIPTLAFFLSRLSLPFIKRAWLQKR
jgi:hypothetical protein